MVCLSSDVALQRVLQNLAHDHFWTKQKNEQTYCLVFQTIAGLKIDLTCHLTVYLLATLRGSQGVLGGCCGVDINLCRHAHLVTIVSSSFPATCILGVALVILFSWDSLLLLKFVSLDHGADRCNLMATLRPAPVFCLVYVKIPP